MMRTLICISCYMSRFINQFPTNVQTEMEYKISLPWKSDKNLTKCTGSITNGKPDYLRL
jgi:hypothetical protein